MRSVVLAFVLLLARAAHADDPAPAPAATEPAAADPAPTEPAPAAPASPDSFSEPESARTMEAVAGGETISGRGVAEEFFVLPRGIDAGMQLRLVNAAGGLGMGRLALTDLALFDVRAQWAFADHFELDGSVSLLPKQPSSTSEPVFQGGGLTLRRDLVRNSAVALAGWESPLLGMDGIALGGSLFVTHKHRLNNIVTLALAGGATSTFVRPTDGIDHPYVVEGAGRAEILARTPCCYGAWLGIGYAVPAAHHGHDPVSGMALDPQPRLDINVGNSVQLADQWDFSLELSIIDRGDLTNPATRLPILDGGFDQIQIMVGISRRFMSNRTDRDASDPLLLL